MRHRARRRPRLPRCATSTPQARSSAMPAARCSRSAWVRPGGADARSTRATPHDTWSRRSSPAAAPSRRGKQVTVLFADLVDSMRLADVLGRGLHRVLDRIFRDSHPSVHRSRARSTVHRRRCDGALRAPLAHEDHARRSVPRRAGSRWRSFALRKYAARPRPRPLPSAWASTSGEVVVERSATTCAWTTRSRALRCLAARMEQLAGRHRAAHLAHARWSRGSSRSPTSARRP